MKLSLNAAEDLQPGDVIRMPVNLRGAEIASITLLEGQTVAYVTGHPNGETTKFHCDPSWPGFVVERPDVVDGGVYYEAGCACALLGPENCPAHKS